MKQITSKLILGMAMATAATAACWNNTYYSCPGTRTISKTVTVNGQSETVSCSGTTTDQLIQAVGIPYNSSYYKTYDFVMSPCYYSCTAVDSAGNPHGVTGSFSFNVPVARGANCTQGGT